MLEYSRRELLHVGAALAAGLGLRGGEAAVFAEGLGKIARRQERVLWLQGMSCSGCSVSLLNTENPGPLEVLTRLLSMVYHPTISAAQGRLVSEVIEKLQREGDYLLVFEGAVPLDIPEACTIGGTPLTQMLPELLRKAKAIVAAGTCASFGGIPGAEGNPTHAVGLQEFMKKEHIPAEKRLVSCPGCPVHPQSMIGTIAYLAGKGYPAVHPELLTPDMFYKCSVHDECPRFHYYEKKVFAEHFGEEGCLFKLGCLGPLSHTNCPRRQWNGGVNWCIRAGAPCIACTNEHFAKQKSFPFYRQGEQYHAVAYKETDRETTTRQ